jgi:hypothetical protein
MDCGAAEGCNLRNLAGLDRCSDAERPSRSISSLPCRRAGAAPVFVGSLGRGCRSPEDSLLRQSFFG